jgi:hypothetical protein
MCAGAMVHVRLERVVYGASDPKAGAAGTALNLLQFPGLNHQCQITGGVREAECRALLQTFFSEQRQKAASPRGNGANKSMTLSPVSKTEVMGSCSVKSGERWCSGLLFWGQA